MEGLNETQTRASDHTIHLVNDDRARVASYFSPTDLTAFEVYGV